MKKIVSLFFMILMMIVTSLVCYAANGDIVGHIYSTDIRAFINGVEIPSYNIGGKTAVVLEDILQENSCVYNDEERSLEFFSLDPLQLLEKTTEEKLNPGIMIGDIYETDIKVSIYDVVIPSYNIGGKTAVAIEDLGYHGAFSPIGGKFLWSEKDRTIRLEFLYDNSYCVSEDRNVTITLNSSLTEAWPNTQRVVHCGGGNAYWRYDDGGIFGARGDIILPIKYGSETILGYYFSKLTEEDEGVEFVYFYPEVLKLEEMAAPLSQSVINRQATIDHFIDYHSAGAPVQRLDTDEYTFLYISVAGTSWTSYHLVRIDVHGLYYDFKDAIHVPNRAPRDLVIDEENEIVTFRLVDRYNSDWYTDYQIDLKNGHITANESPDSPEITK